MKIRCGLDSGYKKIECWQWQQLIYIYSNLLAIDDLCCAMCTKQFLKLPVGPQLLILYIYKCTRFLLIIVLIDQNHDYSIN